MLKIELEDDQKHKVALLGMESSITNLGKVSMLFIVATLLTNIANDCSWMKIQFWSNVV